MKKLWDSCDIGGCLISFWYFRWESLVKPRLVRGVGKIGVRNYNCCQYECERGGIGRNNGAKTKGRRITFLAFVPVILSFEIDGVVIRSEN